MYFDIFQSLSKISNNLTFRRMEKRVRDQIVVNFSIKRFANNFTYLDFSPREGHVRSTKYLNLYMTTEGYIMLSYAKLVKDSVGANHTAM
jgi:hypothetical protein